MSVGSYPWYSRASSSGVDGQPAGNGQDWDDTPAATGAMALGTVGMIVFFVIVFAIIIAEYL
ncbi:hypothetical protein BH24ACT15_BH24ACT15_26500 [soil metagenome]